MTEKYKLANGLSVVLNKMPHMKSASMGIFIKSGSVYENKGNNGIAHFIEHMLFKGTKNRTAHEISEESDELGGNLNAYTAEDCTCVYVKVLSEEAPRAIELLLDIVSNPVFDEMAIENEKKVIAEEISGTDDNPEDAAQEMLMSNMFREHPIGMPVLGSTENVNAFTKKDVQAFYAERYVPENMAISISGNFDGECIKNIIHKSDIAARVCGKAAYETPKNTKIFGGIYTSERDIGQIQLMAGYPAVARDDERFYAFMLLSGILSGDSSSRLFRSLREENGLVYNVDASVAEYEDCGMFVINTSFSAENAAKVMEITRREIKDILENGVTEKELMRAKKNIIASIKLDSEGTMSTMSIEGKWALYGMELSDDEVIERYMAVTDDDVRSAALLAFGDSTNEAIAAMGDVKGVEICSLL